MNWSDEELSVTISRLKYITAVNDPKDIPCWYKMRIWFVEKGS